jgi:hypothetical protein
MDIFRRCNSGFCIPGIPHGWLLHNAEPDIPGRSHSHNIRRIHTSTIPDFLLWSLAACMLWKVPARRQTPVYRYAAFCMRRPPPPFQFQETVESLCHRPRQMLHCHVRFPESPQRQGQNCVCHRPYVLRRQSTSCVLKALHICEVPFLVPNSLLISRYYMFAEMENV